MSIDSQVASDETDRLCDDTIELIGSFGRMLAKARAAKETADASSVCPCGRSMQRHQRNHQQLRAVSSNVSNLDDVRHIQPAGRVLTSPNEIRLLLRLESWIGDNGMLVVKPSLHREQPATMEGCSFGNNSTLQPAHGPLCSDSSENVAMDCGAGAGFGDGGDGDCCEASDEEAMQPVLQPVEPPAEQRQQRPLLKSRKQPQQQEQPPAPSEPTAVSSAKPSRQQLLQQRRERLQSKRSVSAAKVNVGGTVGSRARREVASVPASAQQQQQPPRRRLSRGGGDSTTLIQKLHRLLSAEMKRSG